MKDSFLLIALLLSCATSSAQQLDTQIRRNDIKSDLFDTPPGFREFVVGATISSDSYGSKTQNLVRATLGKVEDGGLGVVYSNDKTRTVEEVWRDRKANCLSLTAFYVAACKSIGISAKFAEAPSISLWMRKGNLVLNEHHVVAYIPVNAVTMMVADFSGRTHNGVIPINPIPEARFRALFHSNRAIELLIDGQLETAKQEANEAITDDSSSGVAWNALGAVEKQLQHMDAAEKAYRMAISTDPENGPACGNLESLLREENRINEANSFRDRNIKIRDKDPYFHAFLAKESLGEGKTQEAINQINRALKIQRMEPDFYLILAQAELDRGERQAAEKAVEKAIHWSLPDQKKRMESKLALIQDQS